MDFLTFFMLCLLAGAGGGYFGSILFFFWPHWYQQGQNDAADNWYWDGIAAVQWWMRIPYNRGHQDWKDDH